jgi:hypothetical protein
MSNPLIEKYNQIHKPPEPPEPPKNPYSHLHYNDVKLIHTLEGLIGDLKSGRASYDKYETAPNYRRSKMTSPYMWAEEKIDYNSYMPYMQYDEGEMITIRVFRSYV